MFKAVLKTWIWSGIDPKSLTNINPIRLTNIAALFVIFVVLIQVPIAVYFWQESIYFELTIAFSSALFLSLVPILNQHKAHKLARSVLISTYALNILLTCMMWNINLNIQYFLVLAVLICPFFFDENEIVEMLTSIIILCALFLSIEAWFYIQQPIMRHTLHQQLFRISYTCIFTLFCLLSGYHLWKNVNRSWRKLANERIRSEQLLLNILPASIAIRLKHPHALIADYFAKASILFADIHNFTPLCKTKTPQQLVRILNEIYCTFDELSSHYGLEKIKTSGDGYMAACGLPQADPNHAIHCCHCALDMQIAFEKINQKHHLNTGLRIGIGCGEVIAGIIGKNKFSYDLWGEAVNLASRMESHGISNKIQTTHSTYELTKHNFNYEKRGAVNIKGVGTVDTYWLLGQKN
ncbi:adenylate/guanylate cyclase domain-containing protein [Paraglaciecola aquimarina]|uniref:Adenylate/guanylate cyclase domain-containing protein n=1 Tax=Paraglaciecola algarum TaxID=3050085 RepID=A0ABS9DBP0_9ALTE|nr:adenylate/guanylate cyclase domain-containing protein [Paraglaciecola sp. G1-23]MCF2950245.1 adenylate/guanylate cyclase domain-containing protein [Paraglaciecola sp. G1-23]